MFVASYVNLLYTRPGDIVTLTRYRERRGGYPPPLRLDDERGRGIPAPTLALLYTHYPAGKTADRKKWDGRI